METVVVVAVTLLLGKCVMVRSACVSHHPCFDQLYLFTVDGRIQTPNWFKPSSDVFLDVLCFMKLREENYFRGGKKVPPVIHDPHACFNHPAVPPLTPTVLHVVR